MAFPTDLQHTILGAHTSAAQGPADFCACCVSATALQQPRQASPERVGEYSQTQLFYRALWKWVKRLLKTQSEITCFLHGSRFRNPRGRGASQNSASHGLPP